MKATALAAGRLVLILLLGGFGLTKFTDGEAQAIHPLLESSPAFSWALRSFGLSATSATIGVIEITTAALLVLGFFRPWAGFVGSLLAAGTFVTTLSFLATTPAERLPFPAVFLAKDVVLLAIAVYLARESWATATSAASFPRRRP